MDLEQLRTVKSAADALSDNVAGSQQVFQSGFEHTGQGVASGSLLLVLALLELSLDFSFDHKEHLLIALLL
jgi:hypothetical protein